MGPYDLKNDPTIPKPMREAGPAVTAAYWANFAGITDHAILVDAVSVALAESGCDPTAVNKNTNGSTDYGVWQINSVHKIPPSELLYGATEAPGSAYAWGGNAKAMFMISKKGTDFRPWSTWPTKAAARRPEAEIAVRQYESIVSKAAPSVAGNDPLATRGQVAGVLDKGQAVDEGVLPVVAEQANKGIAAVGDALDPLANLAGHLTDPKLWTRVGIGAAGVLILTASTLLVLITLKNKR